MTMQLPCDSEGACMQCKAVPGEEERLLCVTCNTPWHLPCLSTPPATLAATANWSCPDCSDIDPHSSPLPAPLRNDLVTAMLTIENDDSLTQSQKAKKRQQLMTGKAPAEDEDDDDDEEEENQTKSTNVWDMLSRSIKCSICLQLPERPVTKWLRQGKTNCVQCRQLIPAKMTSQPRINSALVFAIRMARTNSNPNGRGGDRTVNHFWHNQDRPDEPFTTERAQRNGRANAASGKIFVTVPTDHFGPITAEHDPMRNQGLLVGESWRDRLECRQWGAHFVPVGGIAGQSDRGAQSVVLSGGYVDDEDHGEWFLYTGSGGKDLSGNKRTNKSHSFDQQFEKYNLALQRSSYAPETGVRYDGIYRIEKCWQIAGLQGFKVCRYLFVRCDNEPAPWTSTFDAKTALAIFTLTKFLNWKRSDDRGDRPRPLPVIRELKKATVTFERTESPSWDFDEEDSLWKWKKPPPPSKRKVQSEEHVEGIRARSTRETTKFQLEMLKKRLHMGFSCMICTEVMVSPVTTPCAHNFCKSCLEGKFAGQALVKERSRGGRTLRSQKIVIQCPSCPIDISDYLQHIQVNVDLKDAIESLKANVAEIEKSLESTGDEADALDDNTDSGNQNSAKELNDLPEGSDVDELEDTSNEEQDPEVMCNRKRKKGDDETQSPDDKMDKRDKINKMTEQEVDDKNDSSSSCPLNLP
ncbi:hypothetical protein V8G54_024349 [Vigna mungo]|uniref:RING-type E3 ubiquitin transferase n=1 Tax=Vigna mungo TaxID=3915 RepID=A0AAQ3RSG9_VIGMU